MLGGTCESVGSGKQIACPHVCGASSTSLTAWGDRAEKGGCVLRLSASWDLRLLLPQPGLYCPLVSAHTQQMGPLSSAAMDQSSQSSPPLHLPFLSLIHPAWHRVTTQLSVPQFP